MEVNFSNPIYGIGPSLRQECQEPWAALIDTGAVVSIAPRSFVPHIPIKEKSETLTNINSGNIKVLGVQHVAFITGKVIIHANFLIVEDARNHSLVSTHFVSIVFKFVFVRKESASFNKISAKLFFTIIKVITMHQVWFFPIMFRIIIFIGQTLSPRPETTNQNRTSLRRSMTNHFRLKEYHLRRRESGRSLSASSGTSMHQGFFNTQFSRKRAS